MTSTNALPPIRPFWASFALILRHFISLCRCCKTCERRHETSQGCKTTQFKAMQDHVKPRKIVQGDFWTVQIAPPHLPPWDVILKAFLPLFEKSALEIVQNINDCLFLIMGPFRKNVFLEYLFYYLKVGKPKRICLGHTKDFLLCRAPYYIAKRR